SRNLIDEWRQAQERESRSAVQRKTNTSKKWHQPPVGVVQINVDATLFAGARSYGVGLALRVRAAQLMGYKQHMYVGLLDSKECEPVAVQDGLTWTVEIDYPEVVLETDC
ncbi:hypothetical protein LINGRAHAP2_LOCUS9086, partial [Linum grandiflorum]